MKQVLSVTVRAELLEELRGLVRQAMAAAAHGSGAEPSASVAERALDDVSAAIYDLVRHRCADAVAPWRQALEKLAQQWDGCMWEDVQDVGASIRSDFAMHLRALGENS
jgi:hypothetical protein